MIVKYIYITENAKELADKLCFEKIKDEKISGETIQGEVLKYREFKEKKREIFKKSDFLVFIMATGIVVRAIAELLESKFTDPGIVVMDELGKNVISLLSGHVGGANEFTERIADKIGANPVITTATDVNEKGAFDIILKKLNVEVQKFRNQCLDINSRLLKNEDLYLFIQKEYKNLLEENLSGFTVIDDFEEFKRKYLNSKLGNSKERFITISDRIDYINIMTDILKEKIQQGIVNDMKDEVMLRTQKALASDIKGLFMQDDGDSGLMSRIKNKIIIVVPKMNVLGVGCRKNTESEEFENAILNYLEKNNISYGSISKIGSIALKKDEKCILDFSYKYFIKTEFYSEEILSKVDYLYEKSDFVKKTVGVYSVAEPSCHIMSGGNLIGEKYKSNGITISVGRKI